MRGPLDEDDVDLLYRRAGTPNQQWAAAAQLTEWAKEVHPDDVDVRRASLLVHAGEELSRAGEHEAALDGGAGRGRRRDGGGRPG